MAKLLLSLTALAVPAVLASSANEASLGPNPIRRVTDLLENLQKKVTAEGEKEKGLHEKFACHCSKTSKELKEAIEKREKRSPTLAADLKAAEQQKVQLEADVKKAKGEKGEAESAIADATSLREKDRQAFATDLDNQQKTLEAVTKAVAALEKGMGKSFLQSSNAKELRNFALHEDSLDDGSRNEIISFLDSGYAPASGEVVGMLKQMGEQIRTDIAKSQTSEANAVEAFQNLTAAKSREIRALTGAVESKTQRIGELAVSIVEMRHDLGDGDRLLAEDKKFLADLQKDCAQKAAEFDLRVKTRAEELTALSETIKLLSSDDALDTFKKTLDKPAKTSFLQLTGTASAATTAAMAQALAELTRIRPLAENKVQLDLVLMALQGKSADLTKVVGMVDEMVKDLRAEQKQDESRKDYCTAQLFAAADKAKDLKLHISDKETAIASSKQRISAIQEEITGLEKGMKAMDADVAKALEQRKAENKDFTDLIASNNAARNLLASAKQRLLQFYGAKAQASLVEVSVHQPANASAEKPTGVTGPYAKKTEESFGVIAMLDRISNDLQLENTQAEAQEKAAQQSYEKLVKDSAERRDTDAAALTERNVAKAQQETSIQDLKDMKVSSAKELLSHEKMTASLHLECDPLLQNFEIRKEARESEIEALGRAKATLQGAKVSLLQIKMRTFLGRLRA